MLVPETEGALLTVVLYLQVPAGSRSPVLPHGLKQLSVLFGRDLQSEMPRPSVQLEVSRFHPHNSLLRLHEVQGLEDDVVPVQIRLLPAKVEDERLGRSDKGNSGSGRQEVTRPVFEPVEGERLPLLLGEKVE